jgi:hypothetical protein
VLVDHLEKSHRRLENVMLADAEQRADSPRNPLTVPPRSVIIVPTGNATEKLRE